jgi:hypothetical protein
MRGTEGVPGQGHRRHRPGRVAVYRRQPVLRVPGLRAGLPARGNRGLGPLPLGHGVRNCMDLMNALRQRIETGDREGALRALAAILRADPRNVPAWMLLAALIKDPARQADCYRQVLRLDPANPQATARLRALTLKIPEAPPQSPGQRGAESYIHAKKPGRLAGLQAPANAGDVRPQSGQLSPDDVIQLAGGPLPPEERWACPQCGAVVPRSAEKCAWCGASLSGPRDA